jgi:hypothetical protein
MDVGMLWFDNDKQTDLSRKIERAVNYYQKKYGQTPNLCFVHPCMLTNGSSAAKNHAQATGGIELRESKSMLPNHFWIGINRQTAPAAP